MHHSDGSFPTLEEIGNKLREGLIIFNIAEMRVAYCNEIAVTLTGLDMNSTPRIVKDILNKVATDDRAYVKHEFETLLELAFSTEIEFRMTGKGDVLFPVCCSAFYVSNKTSVVLFIKDISKTKQAENYLIEFGSRKNNMLDTVVHNISGALLLTKHLSMQVEKSLGEEGMEDIRNYLDLLNQNTQHCLDIINDLLKEEYVMAPEISVKTSRMEVVGKLHTYFINLVRTFPNRHFSFDSSEEVIFSNADEFKLFQIINNLISNAIKFTPEDKEIALHIEERNEHVVISVTDQGIGIPTSLQPFVFERNSLAGRTGLQGETSRGFGLFICQQLSISIHGHMWFDSKEGVGTTVYLSIPADK